MTLSECCSATDRHFAAARAAKELRRYRRKGPTGTARRLLRLLEQARARVETVLDVGGGIGVLPHELLAAGARTALQVEASSAYVAAARGEAERRGQADRVSIRHGDFVELAPSLPNADLVTLDRVICCYPDFERLIASSAEKALRFWAASFPRERWFVRLSMAWENAGRARAGNPFRTYVHPVAQVYALLEAAGLAPLRIQRGLFWEYLLCERKSLPAGSGPRPSGG